MLRSYHSVPSQQCAGKALALPDAAIERIHADRLSEHGDRLAHHAFRGELWEKALHYLREMGSSGSKPSIAAFMGGAESAAHLWFRGEDDRADLIGDRGVGMARLDHRPAVLFAACGLCGCHMPPR